MLLTSKGGRPLFFHRKTILVKILCTLSGLTSGCLKCVCVHLCMHACVSAFVCVCVLPNVNNDIIVFLPTDSMEIHGL